MYRNKYHCETHIHMYACGKKWLNNDHDDDDECEHITWEICYVWCAVQRVWDEKPLGVRAEVLIEWQTYGVM